MSSWIKKTWIKGDCVANTQSYLALKINFYNVYTEKMKDCAKSKTDGKLILSEYLGERKDELFTYI